MRMGAVLGVAASLGACSDDERSSIRSVIVVGAGAAGMTTAYLLNQAGVDVVLLEAARTHGGRIKTNTDFVDFPLPMGGEWIHTDSGVLDRIVNDPSVEVDVETIGYQDTDEAGFFDGTLRTGSLGPYSDLKFVGETWLTFFDSFVMPSIADSLVVNTPVAKIFYSSSGVTVVDMAGDTRTADAVVVTVPIQVMKNRDITFEPELPVQKLDAFDDAFVWGGFKAFIEFSEQFFPTFIAVDGVYSSAGQKDWYDAAYGQGSERHVLGLFTIGDQAEPYATRSGDDLRDLMLAELDEMFDGAASRTYVQHITQNWNEEPFIGQGYFADDASSEHPPRMRESVEGLVFFAGDAYTDGGDWSSVHMAAISASEAVKEILDT
ncbi:MAG: monoamine oxidase [Verrucomicrobiales bacterium]|jgi:monoamine oxidase